MAAASPLDPLIDPRTLESAVQKLRAGASLTEVEREAVRRRGHEMLDADLVDMPSGVEEGTAAPEDDELLEDEVLAEADERDGLVRPAAEMLARLRAEVLAGRAGG